MAAAARKGIAVTPAAAFAVGQCQSPNTVRLGLASPEPSILDRALRTLVGIAVTPPDMLDNE